MGANVPPLGGLGVGRTPESSCVCVGASKRLPPLFAPLGGVSIFMVAFLFYHFLFSGLPLRGEPHFGVKSPTLFGWVPRRRHFVSSLQWGRLPLGLYLKLSDVVYINNDINNCKTQRV